MYIRHKDLRAIEALWRELAEFPPGASDQALEYCFGALVRLLGAANAFWVGGVRKHPAQASDLRRGWRVHAVCHFHHDEFLDRLLADVVRHVHLRPPDPQIEALVAQAGATRASLRQELVDNRTWKAWWNFNELLRPCGITDRLVGAQAVDAAKESYIGLDRGPGHLATRGNYGGPTQTMTPLPDSPAICAGAATAYTPDQRGYARPSGFCYDIGAAQTQYAIAFVQQRRILR